MATPDTLDAPLRTCVGCRRRRPQSELVRCAMGPDGPVVGRTAPGRGAWLCSVDCLAVATSRKGLDRALRRPVPNETLAALRIAFEGVISKVEELPTAGARSGLAVPMKG